MIATINDYCIQKTGLSDVWQKIWILQNINLYKYWMIYEVLIFLDNIMYNLPNNSKPF